MVIGLAECQGESERLLREPGVAGVGKPRGKPAKSLLERDSWEYLTLRGREESSVLIGIRKQMGSALELLFWDRRFEGKYKRRSGRGKADAYSRCLIAKVTLDQNVGFFGHLPQRHGHSRPQPPR